MMCGTGGERAGRRSMRHLGTERFCAFSCKRGSGAGCRCRGAIAIRPRLWLFAKRTSCGKAEWCPPHLELGVVLVEDHQGGLLARQQPAPLLRAALVLRTVYSTVYSTVHRRLDEQMHSESSCVHAVQPHATSDAAAAADGGGGTGRWRENGRRRVRRRYALASSAGMGGWGGPGATVRGAPLSPAATLTLRKTVRMSCPPPSRAPIHAARASGL